MSTTEMMITEWAKHRAEGKRKGIDSRHEWQTAPEWAHREADEWVRRDEAWTSPTSPSIPSRARCLTRKVR